MLESEGRSCGTCVDPLSLPPSGDRRYRRITPRSARTVALLAYTTGTSTAVIDVTHGISTRIFAGHKTPVEQLPDAVVTSVAVSPDGQMLAVGGSDGTIALVQADNLGALPVVTGPEDSDAVFTADGRRLLTATLQYGIQAWDVTRRTRVGPSTALDETRNSFGPVVFSPDGRLLSRSGPGRKADPVGCRTAYSPG